MSKPFNIHDWQAKQRLAEHHAGDYKPDEAKDNAQAMNVQDIVSKTGDLDNMEGL